MWKDDLSQNTVGKTLQQKGDIYNTQGGDYFSGPDSYYDIVTKQRIVKLYSGGCYTSNNREELIVTILGSCIACCVHDPITKASGMNHFLLPGSKGSESARYGVNAMELLLNGMYKLKASKSSLIVKVFGGANVFPNMGKIGEKNVAFIKDFLSKEGLEIAAEDVGGDMPRRVHFEVNTGKVLLKKLKRAEDLKIVEKEQVYLEKFKKKTAEAETDITLFED